MAFANRAEAGRRLAASLQDLRGERLVVLGLPRGGVPVAYEVARSLGAPLDVILVRKLGVPFQPELGMGAIGEDGVRIINDDVVRLAGVADKEVAAVEVRERAELDRRARTYRGGRPRTALNGKTAVIVDDGIATGSTARAACRVARAHGAERIVLAVPVAPAGWTAGLGGDADRLVCVETPDHFFAIGQFYANFSQTSDGEVVACLDRARDEAAARESQAAVDHVTASDEDVVVAAGAVILPGHLTLPGPAPGVVLFAHGSGSSRHSPRNRYVATVLNQAGLGTLLFDLLTSQEEADRSNVFDMDLLSGRLEGATEWLRSRPDVGAAPIGYFGASTGAGAALRAAARPGSGVAAVVSRGGRPDLAAEHLGDVTAPTLLIVGGHDPTVLDLNRRAQARLRCLNKLIVVPGATHLFEEPGALPSVAEAAREWFTTHLVPTAEANRDGCA